MWRWFTGTERAIRVIAILLALVGVAILTTAWFIQHTSDQRRADVADNIPADLTTSAPARVPMRPPAHAPNLKTRSAPKPTPTRVVAPIVPQHLYVPAIRINTTVVPKPTELDHDPFLGKVVPSFGVPDDMYTTTWWSSGPRPGAPGMAVVLGHTQIGGYGVFNRLGELRAADVIGIRRDATTLRFAVVSVQTGISKRDPTALQNVLADHPSDARLALLTCSGHFNQGFRESAANTVVFARLVSVSR